MPSIAYFVSPHGFGHAARSAAVLNALFARRPELETHLFTTVPPWFWEDSLDGPFEQHSVVTDVGLVQKSPTEEDPLATVERLADSRPFEERSAPLAAELERLECNVAVCDISPLGVAAARRAGVPSVLVENFTWDWIYRSYLDAAPGLEEVAEEMAELYGGVELHVQARPVCRPVEGAKTVAPVFRRRRSADEEVRDALGLPAGGRYALVTMGGIAWRFEGARGLAGPEGLTFVVFAGTDELERHGKVILLPERSPIYLPDLIAASELVVGKLGYSTVAEAWAAGCRYLYVPRPRFPESPLLAAFVDRHLPSRETELDGFSQGKWTARIGDLLERPRPAPRKDNGADRISELIAQRFF